MVSGMFEGEKRATGDYISWDRVPIGTTVNLKVTSPPKTDARGKIEWLTATNKFNPEKTDSLAFIGGTTPDGTPKILTLRRGSTLYEAVVDGCVNANADLTTGGTLTVKFSGEKDVGKGNPLKLFTAKWEPAHIVGVEEDF